MAPICPGKPGISNEKAAAAKAITARRPPGARLRAICQTACVTTATATSLTPISQPPPAPTRGSPTAARYIKSAEGKVKPTQAASAPHQPARR